MIKLFASLRLSGCSSLLHRKDAEAQRKTGIYLHNNELIQSLIEKLYNDFSIDKNNLPVKKDYSEELKIIKEFLSKRITELMDKNQERFFNTLYRIDVDESRVAHILNTSTNPPDDLADLIIERQLQRLKTQLLYKQGKL